MIIRQANQSLILAWTNIFCFWKIEYLSKGMYRGSESDRISRLTFLSGSVKVVISVVCKRPSQSCKILSKLSCILSIFLTGFQMLTSYTLGLKTWTNLISIYNNLSHYLANHWLTISFIQLFDISHGFLNKALILLYVA